MACSFSVKTEYQSLVNLQWKEEYVAYTLAATSD